MRLNRAHFGVLANRQDPFWGWAGPTFGLGRTHFGVGTDLFWATGGWSTNGLARSSLVVLTVAFGSFWGARVWAGPALRLDLCDVLLQTW